MVAAASLSESFYTAVETFLSFIPRVIGAVLLLVVPYERVRITRRLIEDRETVRATVRSERVDVERRPAG